MRHPSPQREEEGEGGGRRREGGKRWDQMERVHINVIERPSCIAPPQGIENGGEREGRGKGGDG